MCRETVPGTWYSYREGLPPRSRNWYEHFHQPAQRRESTIIGTYPALNLGNVCLEALLESSLKQELLIRKLVLELEGSIGNYNYSFLSKRGKELRNWTKGIDCFSLESVQWPLSSFDD